MVTLSTASRLTKLSKSVLKIALYSAFARGASCAMARSMVRWGNVELKSRVVPWQTRTPGGPVGP